MTVSMSGDESEVVSVRTGMFGASDGGDTAVVAAALDQVVGAAADAGYALDGWVAKLDGTRGSRAKTPSTKTPTPKLPRASTKALSKKAAGAVKRGRSPRGR